MRAVSTNTLIFPFISRIVCDWIAMFVCVIFAALAVLLGDFTSFSADSPPARAVALTVPGGDSSFSDVAVIDDAQTVTVTATDKTASEPGADTGTFTFTRTGTTTSALTIPFTVGGTASSGVDYVPIGTSVTIPASATTQTVTVTPLNNSVAEINETVIVTLSANAAYVLGAAKTATVTIVDDEQRVTITATDASAAEPLSGINTGTLTVTRTGVTTNALTVTFAVSGSAISGMDYVALGTSVVIPAGKAKATMTVSPIADPLQEPDETVVVTLSSSAAYTVGSPAAATVTIAASDTVSPIDWMTFNLTGSATITSYQTGSANETIDGFNVHYTKNSSVGVSVSAQAGAGAVVDSVTVMLGDQIKTITGATGSTTFAVTEGVYDLTMTVVGHSAVGSGSHFIDLKKRLVVDQTKPTIALLLPKRFWPAVADREVGVEEYPLVRRSAQGVWINGMDETWNADLRKKFTMPVFGKASVAAGLIAAVTEQSGLDKRIVNQAIVAKVLASGIETILTGSILDKSSANEDKLEPGIKPGIKPIRSI